MIMRTAPIVAEMAEPIEPTTAKVTSFSANFAALIRKALAVRRERRALLSLDERMLADIGLSRADAYRESHRSFMDVPLPGGKR
jgi:uncharacterized protein YjiS (DUF1127 family)